MIHAGKIATVLMGLVVGVAVALPPSYSVAVADTQAVKKKKKKAPQRQRVKKNYQATPPGEPNQAGMTDDCAFWYNTQGRMPVGCNKYGRSFYMFDDWR